MTDTEHPEHPERPEPEPLELNIGAAVAATVRAHRREHRMSQRALARALGWPQATLSRAETDASAMTLARVAHLLRHTGHRLAIVPIDPGPSGRDGP